MFIVTDNDVEKEFEAIDSNDGWTEYYKEIRAESRNNDFTTHAATKKKNLILNRYRDVIPYDHSRIILSGKCDYINANLLKVDKTNRQYILTQGPLRRTIDHFWEMVWEQNTRAIIMLNRIIEKNQEKCSLYWPLGKKRHGEDTLSLPEVGLEISYISEVEDSPYPITTLSLKNLETGESREIKHFQYTRWPDFGVPESAKDFVRFLCVVRKSGALEKDGPPVVHCSAGIGRSGTFCLVDSCLVLMKKFGKTSVNVRELLLEMRKSRMGLIQTPDQLRFSYQAIIEELNNNWEDRMDEPDEDVFENHIETINTSSEEDCEPPPLPPPRGESLARPRMELPEPPERPLPNEPPIDDLGQNLRERKRNEANKKTAETIAEMKRKQESSENWCRLKRVHDEDDAGGSNIPTKKSA